MLELAKKDITIITIFGISTKLNREIEDIKKSKVNF